MRCVDARTRFDEIRVGTAPASIRRRVQEHLSACPACAEEWEWADGLIGELALLKSFEPPDVDVADRVMARVASLPVPTSTRAVREGAWPWAAAAAATLLTILVATGWTLGPGWAAETARVGGRLVAKAAATLPTWLATGEAILRALGGAARALLPEFARFERTQPLLLGAAYFICAAVFAASIVVAGREWRTARRRTGARS